MYEELSMEREVYKMGEYSNYYSPCQSEPSESNHSIQMHDSDLPLIYQSGDHSIPVGLSNHIYESLTGEHTEGIYEEINENNPFKEDVDALDVATSIHPTVTQMDKENLNDI